jgi:1,4-dihydroxy-2-naphthoate octaprenyltransferase
MTKIKCWIEAMRLRTLPVSVAGVIIALGVSIIYGEENFLPVALCLVFAVLAQISSNFANEYYDFKSGLDKVGRVGPRRGVTEGDITPKAMRNATFITLGLACLDGLSLIYWGGWWLIIAGLIIAVGALSYSAGPYPLSRHCLGEVAVFFFFGIIPVNLTYYVQTGTYCGEALTMSVAAGLMGANVLIINNYRDIYDDRESGKHTLAVKFGRPFMRKLYMTNAIIAAAITAPVWYVNLGAWSPVLLLFYLEEVVSIVGDMKRLDGAALNPLLGRTSKSMLRFAIVFAILAALVS